MDDCLAGFIVPFLLFGSGHSCFTWGSQSHYYTQCIIILLICIIILLISPRFLNGQERGKMLGAQGNLHDFSLGWVLTSQWY